MSNLFWLSEAQMDRLRPFFPKSHGRPRVDDRRVLSGIIFINRNGLRWRDAPKDCGPAKTLYNRWKRWSENGVFARIMMGLRYRRGLDVECPQHPGGIAPEPMVGICLSTCLCLRLKSSPMAAAGAAGPPPKSCGLSRRHWTTGPASRWSRVAMVLPRTCCIVGVGSCSKVGVSP